MSRIGNYTKNFNDRTSVNSNRYLGLYEGIIKENSDYQKMGRLAVWVPELGTEESNADGWVVAMYLSPFGGATNMDDTKEDQTYEGTQRSYGFWAVPPDPGNRVAVQFLNGEPSRAVWIGCFYQQYRNTMIPNIPKHNNYQYGEKVPGAEHNVNEGSPTDDENERPFHRTHYEAIRNQGLETDTIRGFSQNGATSSELSRVYGMLTPKGHYWSMEDTDGDEKIRIRTIGGAQILLDDTNNVIYIANQKANGWVEIDEDGKIMVFSEEGMSVRSRKDIALTADRDLLFEAGRNTVIKTKDQTFLDTTDFYETIKEKHDVDIGEKRSEKIKQHHQTILEDKVVHVMGEYTLGVDKKYNLNVEDNVDVSTRGEYNLSVEKELHIGSKKDASFSSMKKTNIISKNNIVMAGKKLIENSGGNAEPPTPPEAAKAKVSEIPERPTFEYDDIHQKPQDNGTRRRKVRSLASSFPTHEPNPQHSKPSYNRDENADDAGQSGRDGGGSPDQKPETGGDGGSNPDTGGSTPDSGSGSGSGNDSGGSQSGGKFNMKKLREDLKRHEGYKNEVYPDPKHGASHPTAGVGHLLKGSEKTEFSIGDHVSDARIEQWLEQDIDIAVNTCKKMYGSSWDGLSANRKEVLINMSFNLGAPKLSEFKRMNAAVKRGDFKTASMEMRDSAWYHQIGSRSEELAVRMERNI